MRRFQTLRVALLLAGVIALGACSTANGPDPWRETNEKIFRINEGFDKALLAPVATGWDKVTPGMLQMMIGNFFDNLTVPRTFVNDLLQGKPLAATHDLGRLVLNTVVGLGGLVDVSSELGIPRHDEDFGQTFGRWGAGPGPYVILPLAGPYSVRDAASAPLDIVTNPTTWVNVFGVSVVRVVNVRAQYLEEIAQARADAVDYYVFVRDAYLSSRERAVRDGAAAPAADDDLYDLDELDEDEGGETTDAE
ncbi:MAG TPA: VacJ family lipoprotein [Myxococcota bacterium]|jgi:phospholipid-binding lipoprotein MlaA